MQADNSWILAYDNLSGIPHWLSDSLCRLATGGGFSIRRLYTDSEEQLFEAMRPVILNGIDHLPERADLADRAVVLTLASISETDRKDEDDLYAEFEAALATNSKRAIRRREYRPQAPILDSPAKQAANGGFCGVGNCRGTRAGTS